MENTNIEKELGWDDVIEQESTFTLLPEGDYDFTVVSFERARHAGSAKLPPCNKAIVSLRIESPEGTTTLKHLLFLHSKCEGMLSEFFISIGQKKHGEPLKMNWAKVSGSKGHCKIFIDNWTNPETGEVKQSNKVKRFYEPKETKFVAGTF